MGEKSMDATRNMGAVRLVNLDLFGVDDDDPKSAARISRLVGNYLEKNVKPPFRFRQFSSSTFAIHGTADKNALERQMVELRNGLIEFLFGQDTQQTHEALLFSGGEEDVATFLTENDTKARERSQTFVAHADHVEAETLASEFIGPAASPFVYRGILECQSSALFGFAITPRSTRKYLSDVPIALHLCALESSAIEFEIAALDLAVDKLKNAANAGHKVIFQCPVSYRTITSNRARQQFFTALRRHPVWVRDQIILSVVDTPPTPHSGAVQRFVTDFKPWFRFLDWQVRTTDIETGFFSNAPPHSVTLDTYGQTKDRHALITRFLEHSANFRKMKVRMGVTGLLDIYEIMHAVAGGLRYAGGNGVTHALADYMPAQKISLVDLPIRRLPSETTELSEQLLAG